MAVPGHQALSMGLYLIKQRLLGRKRYPINLMLEPLFRCNLACPGCGKIQHPEEVLRKQVTVEEALRVAKECGAPMVTLPGGEPLVHPDINAIVEGLLKQRRYVIVCTNGILLERSLDQFVPNKRLTFSVHLDGYGDYHDKCVDRSGVYDIAVESIRVALKKGFRIIINTTIFEGHDIDNVIKLFDEMTSLGVEGLTLSPGFSYEKASDQGHFLSQEATRKVIREIFAHKEKFNKKWDFNNSPFFLEFLRGERQYTCAPWGMPTYNVFGWQRPCYLLADEGYAKSYQELMEETPFEKYGADRNPQCANCMTHCGYEPTAVADSLSSFSKMIETAKALK